MRATSWRYSINALPECRFGTVTLVEEPLWLAFAGLVVGVLGHGSRLLHWIKFPGWLEFALGDDTTWHSLRDYYGDLGGAWHLMVFNPLIQWHEGHPRRILRDIELGYDKVREMFYDRDQGFFEEHERSLRNTAPDAENVVRSM